jgi:pimeloyl-ACP methyl ester carboxylesterase
MIQETWTHHTLQTNGITLHYVTQGSGDLMLMLHGFPEFWYSWRHQIPEFAQGYKVVALDLRGYNDSTKPQAVEAYCMAELIQDVKGAIEALGYESCILVGHDWGGAIAWAFTYAYPAMVEHLIVMNLPHPAKFTAGLFTPQQLLRSWYIFFFQLPLLPELVLGWDDYRAIATALEGMAINKTAFSAEDLEAYKTAAAKRGALTAMLNYYRANMGGSLGRTWGKLTVPTLLIWGENDSTLGIELTHGTEEYVEDLKICYIPNCSHWVQQEYPDLVNYYMWEFLRRDEEQFGVE